MPTDAPEPAAPIATTLTVSPTSLGFSSFGETQQLSATVRDQNGAAMSGASVAWESSASSVATVSSTGLVTSVADGAASITATSGSATGTASVAVDNLALADPLGGEVSLAEAAVTLVLPAGAVSEPVVLTAEPAMSLPTEPTPIPGTAFDLGPDGIVFDEPVVLTIGYDPADVPPDVPEEELRLHKLVADEYVEVDAGAVDVASNTVSGLISGFSVYAVLRALPGTISREEAIAAARSAYVDQAAAANFVVASMGVAPFPAGTRIQEHHGPDHPVLETVLGRESYFALVDRIPSAGLPHPFTYLFIDAETGEVSTEEAWYPPLIDGVPTYITFEARTDPTQRFEPLDLDGPHPPEMGWIFQFEQDPFSQPAAARSAPASPPAMQPGASGKRVAISVAGGRDSWQENTVNVFTDRMRSQGFETEKLFSKDLTLDQLRQRIVERTAGLGEGDKVVLFMHMHAWVDDANGDGVLDRPSTRLAYDFGGENQSNWPVFSTEKGSVADLLDDIPAESVNLVIQSCGAAGALVMWLPNPVKGSPFQAHPGSTVRVYAASASDRVCKNSRTPTTPNFLMSNYVSVFLDHMATDPLDADGNGELTLDEIESGFSGAHALATTTFAEGDVFDFDQKPPPVGTFTGGTLQIDAAADGAVFPLGETIVFQGQGTDPQKGSLTFPDLTWASDVDGALGMGNAIARNDLSPGEHTITLTGTYTGGQTASRSIKITVGVGGVPQISLTSPLGGTFRRGDDAVEFTGTATDPEDGDLVSLQSILWISDIDGDIGAGSSFERSDLSEGVHTITMEVRDSDGNIARVTTQITILTGVPRANIATPADGTVAADGELISFVGTASDPEDGLIPDERLVWTSGIDGEICGGGGCLRTLSPGIHTITLTATDSDGNTGTAQITVTVNFPSALSLTGTLQSDVGPCIWPPTISNPGTIELVTEVVDGMIFLTIKSDPDIRGKYDPGTGEWMATGEAVFPGVGTQRESLDGKWENEDGTLVFRGTLTVEFVPEDGSEPCSSTYEVEYRPH